MPRAQLPTAQKIMRDFMSLNTTERETLLGVLATYHQETMRTLIPGAEVAGTASGKIAPPKRKPRKLKAVPPAPAVVEA